MDILVVPGAVNAQTCVVYHWFMNSLDELHSRTPSPIIFECVAGSHAYGTSTSSSDIDIRGVFAVTGINYLSLIQPADQISDVRGDIVYYSLRRFIELLANANPNILVFRSPSVRT